MKRFVVLGSVLASVHLQPVLALEPDAAGREARDELNALIDQQRKDKEAANAKPEDNPEQTSSAAKAGRESPKAIENRIPTICKGC